jgi:hypothetical protein
MAAKGEILEERIDEEEDLFGTEEDFLKNYKEPDVSHHLANDNWKITKDENDILDIIQEKTGMDREKIIIIIKNYYKGVYRLSKASHTSQKGNVLRVIRIDIPFFGIYSDISIFKELYLHRIGEHRRDIAREIFKEFGLLRPFHQRILSFITSKVVRKPVPKYEPFQFFNKRSRAKSVRPS